MDDFDVAALHPSDRTTEEIDRLIGNAPCKTCQLDLVTTWLVKEMHGLTSPFVSLLAKKSLADGCFPSVFKRAQESSGSSAA